VLPKSLAIVQVAPLEARKYFLKKILSWQNTLFFKNHPMSMPIFSVS